MAALELIDITKHFGALRVTDSVSLSLEPGARHALIGPNGAGKTTLVNIITGHITPDNGAVVLGGRDITRLPAHERARLGLVRNFQTTNLFTSFSAAENVALALAERNGYGQTLGSRFGFAPHIVEEAEDLINRMRLADVGFRPVGALAYGQQRLVDLAVAIALAPRVLLLDEPAAGLPALDHSMILEALEELPESVAILLIEHDMSLVFRFATQITVLTEGHIIAQGSPDFIREHAQVRAAYLGARV